MQMAILSDYGNMFFMQLNYMCNIFLIMKYWR